MSFPRYERYKDGGVEWLGEVPEHWHIAPLYTLGKEREESNIGLISNNLLSLSYGQIINKDIQASDGLLPESFETYQIVHPGDIIFRLTDLQNDKRSLRTAITTERGIITFAYVAFEPRVIMPAYLNYLLRDYDLRKIFYSMGGGVRQSMKFEDIKRLPTLVPPESEQSNIVNFLDHETAKINALIEEQQRLIELLKEKRQAVISHAVTKGINPKVEMKDSGFPWLGLIPAHWEVGSIKRWFQTNSGGTPSTSDYDRLYATEGGFPWIRTTDINDEPLDTYEIAITAEGMGASACTLLPIGCVLIAMYGGGGTIGKNAILSIPACINQALCALLPNDEFHQEFTFRFIQFYKPYWMIGAVSSRIDPNISQDLIKNAPIVRPPLHEQLG